MSEDDKKKAGFLSRLLKKDRLGKVQGETSIAAEKEQEDEILPEPVEDAAPEPVFAELQGPEETTGEEKNSLTLRTGLTRTRKGFIRSLDSLLLGQKQLDEHMVARLEELLVTADIGVQTAYHLFESVTERVKRREIDDPEKVLGHIKGLIKDILLQVEAPLRVGYAAEPFVVMVVGVNGSGKTTTIAKIAGRHRAAGRQVLIAAADTFRAAAVQQVEIWAKRAGCQVVRGKEKADPSSVVFEALDQALKENVDLVLVDTAGRLHTRVPLMEELKKISRTMHKKIPQAPHETLLVIDASTGQNAILQARQFHEAVNVTGICLTKLDGTAKGGVIVGISNELKIPIRYIGIGEKMEDLREFKAGDFVEALFSTED